MLKYHIVNESGERIASFINESDRDICFDALREYYSDCILDVEDND